MKPKKKTVKALLCEIGAVVLALAVWQIAAMNVGSDMLFASPVKVFVRLTTVWREAGFLSTVFFSLLRVMSGFLLAFVSGTVLAVLAARFSIVETLLRPYIVTIKAVPVASFIILCLIWFSYARLTVFISFLIAFPVLFLNVLQGIRSTDPKLIEVANLYSVPFSRRLLYLYLPSVKPYLISACSIAMGMAWKSGVAAEVIGTVRGSIGKKLYDAKIYFQNADLLAWTVLIVLLSVLSEKLVVSLVKLFFGGVEKL